MGHLRTITRYVAPMSLAIPSASRAEGVGLVGPSFALVFLVLLLPLFISACLAVYMLFDWRRFRALILAVVAFATWLGIASVAGPLGLVMFILCGWVCLGLVAGALCLNHMTSLDWFAYRHRRAATKSPGPALTRCSTCQGLMVKGAAVCPSCRTVVGPSAST